MVSDRTLAAGSVVLAAGGTKDHADRIRFGGFRFGFRVQGSRFGV